MTSNEEMAEKLAEKFYGLIEGDVSVSGGELAKLFVTALDQAGLALSEKAKAYISFEPVLPNGKTLADMFASSDRKPLGTVIDDEDDEEEDDGPDDAGELDELEHMRDVADMAYMALSDLAPALPRPPRRRGMGHRAPRSRGRARPRHVRRRLDRGHGGRGLVADETVITIIGNLTADPELRTLSNGNPVASFTIASTPRTYNRQTQQYEDGTALFLRCSAWNDLARHISQSCSKGMRVIARAASRNARIRRRTAPTAPWSK